MGQAQHPKTTSPTLPPPSPSVPTPAAATVPGHLPLLDIQCGEGGSQEPSDSLMEPVQLMQWWAGVFDLGLFGGEAHGSSVLSTLLSSHKSMETEDVRGRPLPRTPP